ncbi:MAG: hypothetical protein AAF600_03665, partial [Bacteroidota bacterium]
YISSRIRVGIQLTIKCIGFAWLLEEVSCYLLLYQSLRMRVNPEKSRLEGLIKSTISGDLKPSELAKKYRSNDQNLEC